jgi:hypothetical protein
LPAGNGFWKGSALPKFPFGDPPQPSFKIKVERAANPGDIHWEELGKDPVEQRNLFLKTNSVMILIVLVCFGIVYALNLIQWKLQDSEEEKRQKGESEANTYRYISFLPGIGVGIINACLMVSARLLGDREYHETWTTQEFSQAAKMTLALLVNTMGVMLFSNIQPSEWYKAGGLIDDALIILIFDAIVPPLFFYLDIKYQCKRRYRRKLKQDRIDAWNEKLRHNSGAAKEEEAARNQVRAEVEQFKRVHEPSEMDYPRRYANALNTFFCTLFFSPVLPWAPSIGIVGLTVQYWIDKYLLLRWYKRPKRAYSARLAEWSLRMVKMVGPLGFSIAFFFFLSPSWKEKGQVFQAFLLSLMVAAIMIVVPSSILRTLLGLRCLLRKTGVRKTLKGPGSDDAGNEDYYNAQYTWSKEMKYHKDHFLYRFLSEAVNPEMLSPEADGDLKLSDLKDSYGAATGGDTVDTSDAVALKGGRIVGRARLTAFGATDPAPVAYGAASGTTVKYGAGAAPPADVEAPAPTPEPAPAQVEPAPAPVAPVAAAITELVVDLEAVKDDTGAPKPHPPASKKQSKVVWQYEGDHGFEAFKDDCQEFIERKYKEHHDHGKGGGKGGHGKGKGHDHGKGKGKEESRVDVRTHGNTVSIDFGKMTSLVTFPKKGKVRNIRRLDTE